MVGEAIAGTYMAGDEDVSDSAASEVCCRRRLHSCQVKNSCCGRATLEHCGAAWLGGNFAISIEVLGDLLATQTGVQAAKAVIAAPSIRALTDLCPTGIGTPNVWHLSYRFCVSVKLMRDVSPTR